MTDTVHIDAFQTNLHGAKILLQAPFPRDRVPPLQEHIELLKNPFQRKVLLTNAPMTLMKPTQFPYDAIFHIKDTQDWSLALTYILHAPKDVLVMIEDLPVPDGVWVKLPKSITVIHRVSAPMRRFEPYDTIFYAPIEDLTSPYADVVYRQLTAVYKKAYTVKDFREILQELRVAKAGLAWTRIGEPTTAGALYWYDPVGESSEQLSKKQLADLFSFLSNQFN
jgi:hypothetical protein